VRAFGASRRVRTGGRLAAPISVLVAVAAIVLVVPAGAERASASKGLTAGSGQWLNAVAYSPDGRFVAAGGNDGAVRLWDTRSSSVRGHPLGGGIGSVTGIAYARDGRTLAIAYATGIVRLWNVGSDQEAGVPLRIPGGSSFGVSLAFTSSGHLVTAARDVRIWNAQTTRQVGDVLGRADGFVAVSPDGHAIAAGDLHGNVRLWDSRSRKQLGGALKVDPHRGEVDNVAFDADGRRIAVVGGDAGVSMWDVRTRMQLSRPFGAKDVAPDELAFSPDGHTLAAIDYGQIILRDLDARTTVVIRGDGAADSIAFSPDGQTIATGGPDGAVRFWNVHTHRLVGKPLIAYPTPYSLAAFSPDDHTVAASVDDGTLRLWDTRSEQLPSLALKPTNNAAAIAYCDGPAEPCGNDTITGIRFSANGSTVTAVNNWPSVSSWDTVTGQQLGQTTILDDSGDYGGAFVASSADGNVTAQVLIPWFNPPVNAVSWQYAGSAPVPAPGAQDDDTLVNAVALSPDGQILAVAGNSLWLWDTLGRQQMAAKWGASKNVFVDFTSLAFTPVGQVLLAGASNGSVGFWNPWTLHQLGTSLQASPNNEPITSIAFSPDGTTFATASDDWTIRLWNSRTHIQIGPALQDNGPVSSIAFSPDGLQLISAGLAGLRLWHLRPAEGEGSNDGSSGHGGPLGARRTDRRRVHTGALPRPDPLRRLGTHAAAASSNAGPARPTGMP
jgi:WD40 repeat protein